MKKLLISLVIVCLVSFTFYNCSKTKGDTGPAGPAGTANVMYSNWAALKMTFNTADSAYEQTIAADSVTQSVLDSGLVLSYIKYTNASNQVQVEPADNYMEVVLGLKTINLYSLTYDFTGTYYRYLVVHGGTLINGRLAGDGRYLLGYTRAQWKAMPYQKAISLLGLE